MSMMQIFEKTTRYVRKNLLTNRNTPQTVIKNSLWLLLSEGVHKGGLFLVTILVGRSYSVEQYGMFGFIFSIMTLIAITGDFGLASITICEAAGKRSEAGKVIGRAFRFKAILMALSLLLMAAASCLVDAGIRLLAIVAGIAILIEGVTDYLRISFRVAEQTQYELLIRGGTATLLLAMVFAAIRLELSLNYVVAAYLAANLAGLLLTVILVWGRISFTPRGLTIGYFFRKSWPLFLGLACTTLYGQTDLLLITWYRGYGETGLYQAAYRLMFGFQLLRVVHLAMFPRMAILHAGGEREAYRRLMRQSILWSLVLLIPIGVAATLFPVEIVGLAFGPAYHGAAIALPLLIWSGIMSFVATFFSNTLMISGHQRSWLVLEFLVLALLVTIEVTLIPRLGLIAAAIATCAGEAVFLVLIALRVRSLPGLGGLFFSCDQKGCQWKVVESAEVE